jgi:hypothetical protein
MNILEHDNAPSSEISVMKNPIISDIDLGMTLEYLSKYFFGGLQKKYS